jgi:RNA polymerase sigma-70 factor (ECF subfamily)
VNNGKPDVRSTRMRTAVEGNGADLLAYFSRRVTPVEDAADLLADTLMAVWRRVADLPADGTGARMWMFGVARRVCSPIIAAARDGVPS